MSEKYIYIFKTEHAQSFFLKVMVLLILHSEPFLLLAINHMTFFLS